MLVCLLWLALWSKAAHGQESSEVQDTLIKVEDPQAFNLLDIPEKGKETRFFLNTSVAFLENRAPLQNIVTGLENLSPFLKDKVLELSDTNQIFKIDRLDKESLELSFSERELEIWGTTLQNDLEESNQRQLTSEFLLVSWTLTLDSLNVKKPPEGAEADSIEIASVNQIKGDINLYITELGALKDSLSILQDELRSYQTILTNENVRLKRAESLLEARRAQVREDIWIPDYPAIWNLEIKADSSQTVGQTGLVKAVEGDMRIAKGLMKTQPKIPYYALFYFLAILFTLLFLRKNSAKYKDSFSVKEFEEAEILLKHPFSSSIVVGWFGAFLFFNIPENILKLVALVAMVPVVYLVHLLNPNWSKRRLLLFTAIYLLFLFLPNLYFDGFLMRTGLILLLFALLYLVNDLRKRKTEIIANNPYWGGTIPTLINLFTIFCWIGLIAAVLGNVRLAQLLINTLLGTALFFVVLKTAVTLLRSFISLMILGPLYRHSLILQNDAHTVIELIHKALKIIGFLSWLYVFLHLLGIYHGFKDLIVNIVTSPLSIGKLSVSLWNFMAFIIVIQASSWLSDAIRYILQMEVFPRLHLKSGVPNTISLMVRFTLALFGLLFAFAAAGVDLDKLSVALGAVGVGIGFGLQNIANNFISGIILALERPIQIGDYVVVNEVSGIVKDIGLRASQVRTWSGSDVLVPNGDLVSNKLTNWTFSDRLMRVQTEIRVPFDTELDPLLQFLLEKFKDVPGVLRRPAPYLNLRGISESAIIVDLYCWIPDATDSFSGGTRIKEFFYTELRKAGYDIPLPKQELKIHDDHSSEESEDSDAENHEEKPSTE